MGCNPFKHIINTKNLIFVILTSIEFSVGGGTYLTFYLYKALSELGFHKILMITPYYNVNRLYKVVKVIEFEPKPYIIFAQPRNIILRNLSSRLPKTLRMLFYDKELVEFIAEVKTRCQDKSTVVISSGIFPLKNVDIAYIHYPAALALSEKLNALNLTVSVIYKEFVKCLEKYVVGNPYIILANSCWTAVKIHEFYPCVSSPIRVLYPPVDLKFYLPLWGNVNRKNYVVTIAAFSPSKRLEAIINLARKMPRYKFIIIGSLSNHRYFNYIRELIRKQNVSNVILLPNAPKLLVKEVLRKSRYYIHPPLAEHFGIAVAEACASGLIPIVYRDGGAWFDIASRISYMLGYRDIEEAPQIIEMIDRDRSLYEELRQRSRGVVIRFSYETFKQRLFYTVKEIIERIDDTNTLKVSSSLG